MKKEKSLIVILILYLLLLVGFLIIFPEKEFKFSEPSGFYDNSFYLSISAPKWSKIYYTLDGTDPDESSILYKEPILIEDVSFQDNVYSARNDIGFGYCSDGFTNHTITQKDFNVVPNFPVDKCTVIKAMYIDWTGKKSDIIYGTYFVGYGEKEGYKNVNIISVITPPDNFFDSKFGIYALNKDKPDGCQNYEFRGSEWEREVYVQFFDENGKEILSQKAGVRIHGRFSRSSVPRSLNFYSRTDYDGNPVFGADLFNTGYFADTVTLFAGGQDMESMFKDKLVSELVEGRDVAVMHYVPYVMFLDGEYWGFYWLTEKYDSNYLQYYYGEAPDKVLMIKDRTVAVGSNIEEYNNVFGSLSVKNADYEECKRLIEYNIDIQSMFDYIAIETYIGNLDIDHNNAVWKGKDNYWKYMLFDVNGFSSISDYNDSTLETYLDESELRFLFTEEQYKEKYIETVSEICKDCFSYELVEEKLDEYKELYGPAIMKSNERFFGSTREKEWTNSVNQIKKFFKNREKIYNNQLNTL